MNIWNFVQDQILGMEWLESLVSIILKSIGIDITSRLGGSLEFFIYDSIKILILLIVLIFCISYIQSYFPPERSRKILGKYKGIKGNIVGALLGTVTPFCSCSSIPIFIGFSKAGLSMGVIFSFLISSPFVDLAALILLTNVFGIELAVMYVILGILMSVIGGTLIEKMNLEDQIMEHARPTSVEEIPIKMCACSSFKRMSKKERASYSIKQVESTLSKVWIYILIGVGIGALIHNWIPSDFIQTVLGSDNPFSVIIATLIGIPIYADIFGTIPIAEALFEKGVGAGTILAFMMGVTATSIPSIAMLKGVCKTKLLVVFISIVIVGTIIMGYMFNIIQPIIGL